jgi:hypothetical protein
MTLYDVNTENEEGSDAALLWQEAQEDPEAELPRKLDTDTIQGLVAALPEIFREVIVLRELEDLGSHLWEAGSTRSTAIPSLQSCTSEMDTSSICSSR